MKTPDQERSSLATLTSLVSLRRVRDVVHSTFWWIPALCVTASIGIAIGLIALDHQLPASHAVYLYPGPPAGARSVCLPSSPSWSPSPGWCSRSPSWCCNWTSGQFPPRVLRMFLGDRTIQFALGLFLATFVYAMVVQREVRGASAGAAAVPWIAVTGPFVFVLGSVPLFIASSATSRT